jgi:NAD(P)H dehydrogenase (quinone)
MGGSVGKILVTGASGYLGRETLVHLLNRRPADELVALVRDPAKAEDLAARGIELRQGDYHEPDSLTRAFADVDKVMLTAAHAFTDRKTAHANVIDAAAKSGVEHLVFMPIIRKQNSTFSLPEITEEDRFTEERLLTSGLKWTLVRHPAFLDTILPYTGTSPEQPGVYVPAGDGKFTTASRDDLAEAHAEILTGAGHENNAYSLTGDPAISFSDIATILTEIAGAPITYTPLTEQQYLERNRAAGVPDLAIEFVLGWLRGMNAGEWQEQTHDLEKLLGRRPTSPAEFFRKQILNGGTQ